MEVTLAVVAAAVFIFLTVGLYSGARVRKREVVAAEFKPVGGFKGLAGSDAGGCLDFGSLSFDLGDGCGEVIGGLVIGIVLMILLVVGLWLFLNVALIVFFLLSIAVGWVFHRALRQVFAKSRLCRGDLVNSLYYAAIYTLLYTGWLFAVLMLVERLTRNRA
jgi:hypothetical protein